VLGWIRFDYQRISTVADHYVYLAMSGPALVLCGLITLSRPRSPEAPHIHAGLGSTGLAAGRAYGCVAAALLAVLAVDSFHQLGYWRTNLAIWQHAVAIAPNCPEAHENLGFAYSDLGPRYAKEQAREFGIAVKMKPDNVRDRDLLAGALIATGQVDRAIEQMKITMLLQERHDRPGAKLPDERLAAYLSLGDLLLAKNRPDEAAQMFRKILRQLPNDPTARQHLELCVFRLPKEHPAKPVMLGSSQF
jgi:tetratricopeptide (TPR) repeat protein